MTVPRYTPIRRAHSCFPSSSQRFVYQAPGSSAEPGTGYVPACGRAGEVIGGPGAVVRSYPFHRPGLLREVADEPVPGQPGGRGEGARLLEQVGGAGHHSQVVLAPQLRLGPAVEVQHHLVMPADDEQCRSGHGREPGAGKIGAAAAGTTAAVPAPGSAAAHSAAAPIRTLAGTPSARAEASCPRPFPPGLLQPPRGPADPRQHPPVPPGRLDLLADRHPPIGPAAFRKLDAVAVLTGPSLPVPQIASGSSRWPERTWAAGGAGAGG